ncbi:MAG: hypothetical protein Q4C95_10810 [Planctomycetia bacterium]|nr:hypothetical protein [Planctomycetia bacterium]
MKNNHQSTIYVIFFFLLLTVPLWAEENESAEQFRDLYSDTWVGTDALGRKMPLFSEVGKVKTDQNRVVGIFYITWHTQNLATLPAPYEADVTKILQAHPEARLDAKHPAWKGGSFHWGEPEMGYFLSQDEYVIRKDMSMLTDAGVDVLILDVTNAILYWDEWEVLFSTMEKMKAEGNKVPQFCFWAFNGPAITIVQHLYDNIYKKNRYPDLWFYWGGKPLLLYNGMPSLDSTGNTAIKHSNPHFDPSAKSDPNHPHYGDPDYANEFYADYTKEVKDFFTLRTMWWGNYKWGGKRFIGTEDNWSFGYDLGDKNVQNLKLEELLSLHDGQREQAAVTPGQHPAWLIGKSWTRENGEPELNDQDMPVSAYVPWLGKTVENPEGYGIYFQDRWNEALQTNPQFIYINDWNEWTAGKYSEPEATLKSLNFMRRGQEATYFFVDQYNAEFNRCIQPMKDGYTDNYYMQMAQNIRRYKGVRPIPTHRDFVSVDPSNPLAVWEEIKVEFRDTKGDVFHRDHPGYAGLHYQDVSGRNDIVTAKVGVDEKNVYFLAECDQPLTASTDQNWMLLLVDVDQNPETGWFGYEWLINQKILDSSKTTLMAWKTEEQSGHWEEIAELPIQIADDRLAITVPRSLFNKKSQTQFSFDFKWSDNPSELKDPISFCTAGDTAPNRRFNYRFLWKK